MSDKPIQLPRSFDLISTTCEECGSVVFGDAVFNPRTVAVTPMKPRHCNRCGHRLYETAESDV
jgi:hypothetical protein